VDLQEVELDLCQELLLDLILLLHHNQLNLETQELLVTEIKVVM
jgi:hypothetical protein